MSPEERIGHAILAGWTLRFDEIPVRFGNSIYTLHYKRPGSYSKQERVRLSGGIPDDERWETLVMDAAGVPRWG